MRPSCCVDKACHCVELEFAVSPSDESLAGVREDDERITMTVAQDDYCPNPTCTCREAHVSFATAEGIVGRVTVSFETDELRMNPGVGWSTDELQAAWDAYVDRWPNYRSRLEERYERLRAELHNAMQRKTADFSAEPTPRRKAKVGRNAPCPCGSGRKYKRCCGR